MATTTQTDDSVAASDHVKVLRLNIPFDTRNRMEESFLNLYDALPHGFKSEFLRAVLLSAVPSQDQIELVLVRLISARASGQEIDYLALAGAIRGANGVAPVALQAAAPQHDGARESFAHAAPPMVTAAPADLSGFRGLAGLEN